MYNIISVVQIHFNHSGCSNRFCQVSVTNYYINGFCKIHYQIMITKCQQTCYKASWHNLIAGQ